MSPSAAIPEGSVVITPFQMYQEQQEMNKTLQSVANTLDALTQKIDHSQEDQSRRMDAIDGKDGVLVNHDRRIGSLERWRWISTGAAAVLSSAGTAAVVELVASKR